MRFPFKSIIMPVLFALVFYGFTTPKENDKAEIRKGIDFYKGDYHEALEKAKQEKKLVFVYIYANWCGVCKALKKNTFRDKSVGKLYNKEFVNLALNGEKGEGAEIAKGIGLRSYPTLLYLDGGSGRILTRVSGYKSVTEFINLGKIYTQK